MQPRPPSRRLLIGAIAVVWCALAGLGLDAMFVHATTSGDMIASPDHWPADTRLARGSEFTIAIFVHPDCPCSRASLHELAAIRISASTTLDVVVAGPDAAGEVWDDAGRIPGAVRIVDDGREAARFGALTSGYTVVYDRDGIRRFAGGITDSRGHVGANAGRDAVQRVVAGLPGDVRSHPVFGCALGTDVAGRGPRTQGSAGPGTP